MNLSEMAGAIEKKIQTIDFEALWPGFHRFDFAIYNDLEVCLNGVLIPKTEDFLANTAILYQGRWTAIFMVDEDEDMDILASKIVHEMFHAFQYEHHESRFPDELEAIWKYEYTIENLKAKLHENRLLAKLVKDGFEQSVWNEFLSSKKQRWLNHPDSYLYEAKVEQIEGTANYIELKCLQIFNAEKYQNKLEKMLAFIGKTENLFPIRIGLYHSGAFLIQLLKEQGLFFYADFSDTPFSISILDSVHYPDEVQYDDREVKIAIDDYFQKLDELIDRITKNGPMREGAFDLEGVNVYDAKYSRGYLYTTYFLAYRDGGNPIILNGNFLIRVDGNKISKIYPDQDAPV